MDDDLKYIRAALDGLRDDVTSLKVDVGKLQVKAGIWGSIAAIVVVALKSLFI